MYPFDDDSVVPLRFSLNNFSKHFTNNVQNENKITYNNILYISLTANWNHLKTKLIIDGDLCVIIYRSSTRANWAKIESPFQLGTNGSSLFKYASKMHQSNDEIVYYIMKMHTHIYESQLVCALPETIK